MFATDDSPPVDSALTYYEDIQPIYQEHCGACHAGCAPDACAGDTCFATYYEALLFPALAQGVLNVAEYGLYRMQATKRDPALVGGLVGPDTLPLIVPDEDIGYGLAVQGGQVVVDNLHIDTTSTGLTEEGDETGDGLVVTGRDSGSAPETFSFTMSDSTVTDSARAGVLLDGVAATLEGNTLSGSGLEVDESGILIQGGAIADGSDEVANVSSELGLNIQVLAIELVD